MTTIHHHPDDEWLLALAAGRLDSGAALVVGAHVEGCAHCRARVGGFESIGGALLETLEPALLAPEALARTLARLDAVPTSRIAPARPPTPKPPLPPGIAWPRVMDDCGVTRWRWLGPGMYWSRATLPHDSAANVFLLRIGAGKCLPRHTHSEVELTQVLCGAFDDGRATFSQGDFDAADGTIRHQPVVHAGAECICLASVRGKVLFDGAIARLLGAMVGM